MSRFETGLIPALVVPSIAGTPALISVWGRCCAETFVGRKLIAMSERELAIRQIPLSEAAELWHGCGGMLSREGGLPFDLSCELGFRNSRKQF